MANFLNRFIILNLEVTLEQELKNCPKCGGELTSKDGRVFCESCKNIIEENPVSSNRKETQPRAFSYGEFMDKKRHSRSREIFDTKTNRRNFQIAIAQLSKKVNDVHLPQFVKNEAIKYYKEFVQKEGEKVRKDQVDQVISALVYIVCRESNICLPLEEAVVDDTNKTNIFEKYRELVEKLQIDIKPPSAKGYTLRLGKRLGLNRKSLMKAKNIVDHLEDKFEYMGKDPNGIAAAAVYRASNKELKRKKVAKESNINTVTLRNHLKSLKNSKI